MSVYFVLKFRIFETMEALIVFVIFVLKMFVIMRNTSDILFLCLIEAFAFPYIWRLK